MASSNNRPFNKAIQGVGSSTNCGNRDGRIVNTKSEILEGGEYSQIRSRDHNMENDGRWKRVGRYNRGARSRFLGGRGRGCHPRSGIDMNNETSNQNRSHLYGRGRRNDFPDRSLNYESHPRVEYFKVLIPGGEKHNQKWLFGRLQALCDDILTPINKHFYRGSLAFYIDDHKVANSLRKGKDKMTSKYGSELTIIVKSHKGPPQEDTPFEIETDTEILEILKQFLFNRYDSNQNKNIESASRLTSA